MGAIAPQEGTLEAGPRHGWNGAFPGSDGARGSTA
jgi:hypothetical protein